VLLKLGLKRTLNTNIGGRRTARRSCPAVLPLRKTFSKGGKKIIVLSYKAMVRVVSLLLMEHRSASQKVLSEEVC